MRYLGIDYGKKRVGLAVSDEMGKLAFPETVLPNTPDLVATITDFIRKRGIEAVVIGHSMDGQGNDNPIQTTIETFMTELSLQHPIPIHLQPEQFSSQEAKRYIGPTAQTDAAAAAIILNNYLLQHHD